MNVIFNEDCLVTMQRQDLQDRIDLIITSPPYNISRTGASDKYNSRYDNFKDLKRDDQYIDWTIEIFNGYNKILRQNGCVLYNLSYSSENSHLIWLVIAEIIKRTPFTTADCIIWKKSNAIPNNRSKNKLTRIIEYIFVFCRKEEFATFNCNKKIISTIERTGQANYENILNFMEARNNDGSNDLNKATFSTDLVRKLLKIYGFKDCLVYDSFMGIGTTAKACLLEEMRYVGSEISLAQIKYFETKIN